MLLPVQSITDPDSVIVKNENHFALMKANWLMGIYILTIRKTELMSR